MYDDHSIHGDYATSVYYGGNRIMKDYKKAEQAINLLGESGVNFILVYHGNGNEFKTVVTGKYADMRSCAVGVMARIAQHLKDNGYNDVDAIRELFNITVQAIEMVNEAEKKEKS